MKKLIPALLALVLISMTGCSYYDLGTTLGTALAYPVEAAFDVTAGVLDGFFYGDWDMGTDYTEDTYTPEPEPTPPPEEELKAYKRNEHGNITW